MLRLLVAATIVPGIPIFVTLIMGALRSSETSVLTRATRRNITEDGNLHWNIVHQNISVRIPCTFSKHHKRHIFSDRCSLYKFPLTK
jgi:hypothetical protein